MNKQVTRVNLLALIFSPKHYVFAPWLHFHCMSYLGFSSQHLVGVDDGFCFSVFAEYSLVTLVCVFGSREGSVWGRNLL